MSSTHAAHSTEDAERRANDLRQQMLKLSCNETYKGTPPLAFEDEDVEKLANWGESISQPIEKAPEKYEWRFAEGDRMDMRTLAKLIGPDKITIRRTIEMQNLRGWCASSTPRRDLSTLEDGERIAAELWERDLERASVLYELSKELIMEHVLKWREQGLFYTPYQACVMIVKERSL